MPSAVADCDTADQGSARHVVTRINVLFHDASFEFLHDERIAYGKLSQVV
jgi:hypothetical protein